ncbi:MAG: CoA pyrophosphatase [Desulfuromonadales bacterium]|nr:CoA pyrophosphatase [Desulfuromonadales bacterium]
MLDRDRLARHLRTFPRQTIPPDSLRPAAVLLPLFQRDGRDFLLFTERTAHLQHHAGEISFPGGGHDAEDSSLRATALRETEEELGIAREQIELLGRLDDFYSIHGYHVVPFVGTIPVPDELQLDPFEIAATFEVPLDFFRDPTVHHVEDWQHRGRTHPVDFYRFEQHVIWGLTAAILRQFLEESAAFR